MQEEYTNYQQEYPEDINQVNNSNNVNSQSPQYDRIVQEEKVSNFIMMTSPSRTLTKVDWMLRGFVYDEVKKEWAKVSQGVPDKIRMDFLQILSTQLTEDVRMGRLDGEKINGIMDFLIEWTVDYLDVVADVYNISEEQMTKISIILWSATFYTLCRSQNGVERDRVYNSLKLGDSLDNYMKEPPKSMLSQLLPWK